MNSTINGYHDQLWEDPLSPSSPKHKSLVASPLVPSPVGAAPRRHAPRCRRLRSYQHATLRPLWSASDPACPTGMYGSTMPSGCGFGAEKAGSLLPQLPWPGHQTLLLLLLLLLQWKGQWTGCPPW